MKPKADFLKNFTHKIDKLLDKLTREEKKKTITVSLISNYKLVI